MVTVAVFVPPICIRSVKSTSVALYGEGARKKSAELTAFPFGVTTVTWPEPPCGGTREVRLVAVAAVTCARAPLKATTSFRGARSKFVPVMETESPAAPIVDDSPVIVGALDAATVKGCELVAEPLGEVTLMGPVVAVAGTVATIVVGVEEDTVPVTPLNFTVF